MATTTAYQDAKQSLRQLYLDDPRPWLVGFSGGKDSTMVASLVFDAVLSSPPDQRKKPVAPCLAPVWPVRSERNLAFRLVL